MTEISDTDDSVTLEATYGGKRYDPVSDGDELSSAIVKKCCNDISFKYEGGTNTFKCDVKRD